MKLLVAALVLAFAVAIAASVVAVWASVADAPWEDDAPAVIEETNDILCEGALSLRASVIAAGEFSGPSVPSGPIPRVPSIDDVASLPGNPGGLRDYDEQLAKAEREIERYC